MQCAVSDAKKGEGEGGDTSMIWKKEKCKGKRMPMCPQGKANCRRKLPEWGRGKEYN